MQIVTVDYTSSLCIFGVRSKMAAISLKKIASRLFHFYSMLTFPYFWHHHLGKFSRWQVDDSFLFFPEKKDLAIHANCLKTVCMNCQNLFSGENKKIYISAMSEWYFFFYYYYFFPETGLFISCKLSPNAKTYFLGKIRKNISLCHLLKF